MGNAAAVEGKQGEVQQITLGEMVRRKRRSEGKLSQAAVGALFGVDQSTVAKWERGDPIAVHRLDQVGHWLGLTFEEAYRLSRGTPLPMPGGSTEKLLADMTQRVTDLEAVILEMSRLLQAQLAAAPVTPATKTKPAARKTAAAPKAAPKAAAGRGGGTAARSTPTKSRAGRPKR